MATLTAADYADTGQWRLIVKIWPTGISAHLENTIHRDVELQELFTTTWEGEAGNILEHIENAVYDHPRVLDDFSARIVVYDRKTLFMPTELLTETEGTEEGFYTTVYDSESSDVMCDSDGDITAAFSLAPGLKGFLSRTFPGARIDCNLMRKVRRFRREGDGKRLHVWLRPGECDCVLLDGTSLLSASTHSWNSGYDILYHAFNLLDVYGVETQDTKVLFGGVNPPDEVSSFMSGREGELKKQSKRE
ncbi:MAG: DUF3822 family protein [Muribaculaceae bacterium]|nr:DUF3822 family protein [Muribaculaceae bacterium]